MLTLIVSSSTIDKIYEIYTFYENKYEIYTFYENRYEIYTFCKNGYEICIFYEFFFVKSGDIVPIFVKSVIS